MKRKVTSIISNIDKAVHYEMIADNLDKGRFDVSYILLNPEHSYLEKYLKERGFVVYFIKYRGKNDIVKAILKTIYYLWKLKPDVVHCDLLDAGLVGMLAAKILGIKKRIYTRHHADAHHKYHPNAVKFDQVIQTLATDVTTVSKGNIKVLTEMDGLDKKKIHLLHNCFDIEGFKNVSEAKIEGLRAKYNPYNKRPVIGVISRYIELKGIQYIIPAVKALLADFPDLLLVLANARGNYATEIKKMLKESLPEGNYVEIEFESNVAALYKLFDIFVHTSVSLTSESAGSVYVEALAAGVPSVFTICGLAEEFIVHNENAFVVDYRNSEEIRNGIYTLLMDSELANKLRINGQHSVEAFHYRNHINKLEKLYEK